MTALNWDAPGERIYQTGVDRGVLFLQDGRVVVWNGLTSVEDTTTKEYNEVFLDGLKYLEYLIPGDFSANLKAFTYPDEFDEVNGVIKPASGFRVYDQPSKSFTLSYRTKVGDDLVGTDAGYIIHIIYNVLANPDSHEYATIGESGEAGEFSWVLNARPISHPDWRPTAHFSIDSRDISSGILGEIEDILYGTDEVDPSVPDVDDILSLIEGAEPEVLDADFTFTDA
jgi:hypothetical protein